MMSGQRSGMMCVGMLGMVFLFLQWAQAQVLLSDGLEVYCPMDVGQVIGTRVVDVVGGNDGRSSGDNVQREPAMIGQGLRFTDEGGFDYVSFTTAPKLTTGSYTVSLWFLPDNFSGQQFLLGSTTDLFRRRGWFILGGGGIELRARYDLDLEGDRLFQRTESAETAGWQHLAFVVDRESGRWTMYRNGSAAPFDPDLQVTPSPDHRDVVPEGADFASGTLRLGYYTNDQSGFAGMMDEFGIWTRALSDVEIATIYSSGRSGVPLGEITDATNPPVIARQPSGGSYAVGETMILDVALQGAGEAARYQWYKDDEAMAGETSSRLELLDIGVGAAGSYGVAIATATGAVVSSDAIVDVSGLAIQPGIHLKLDDGGVGVLDVEGDLMVMGIPFRDVVRLFRRDAEGRWEQEQQLICPTDTSRHEWGASVAVSDGRVFVAAGLEHSASSRDSYVSVYEQMENGVWSEAHRIAHDGLRGVSMGVSGNVVVIGDISSGTFGEAFVFEADADNGWTKTATFAPSSGNETMRYGAAVAIDGETIVVTAPSAHVTMQESEGAAWIYQRNGIGWYLAKKLELRPEQGLMQFGSSVDVSGGAVAIGAPNFNRDGGVVMYERSPLGNWEETSILRSSVNTWGQVEVGHRIVLNGDRLIYGVNPGLGLQIAERSRTTGLWRDLLSQWYADTPIVNSRFFTSDGETFIGIDSQAADTLRFLLLPPLHNTPPRFESDPVVSVQGDALYEYVISASDADGHDVILEIVEAPEWLTLRDNGDGTAVLAGSTGLQQVNRYPVVIGLTDVPAGARVLQRFELSVTGEGAPLTIAAEPQDDYVALEKPLYLYVGVQGGRPPLTYQWFFNGVPLNGETGAELVIDEMTADTAGSYHATVSDAEVTRQSRSAIVRFLPVKDALVVPREYETIQEALDAAGSGHTVFVRAGEYPEWLDFGDKEISLVSLEGAASTILYADLDAWKSQRHLLTMGAAGRIEGFTFRSLETETLGNIEVTGEGAQSVIRNCVFDATRQRFSGADSAIYITAGEVTVDANVFRHHPGERVQKPSLVYASGSETTVSLTNNLFYDNARSNCVELTGIKHFSVVNNTFVSCYSALVVGSPALASFVRNNIFVDTSISVFTRDGEPDLTAVERNLFYSLELGSTGIDPIVADPLFLNPDEGDYRLRAASPALDAGLDEGAPEFDHLGAVRTNVDIGAFEGGLDLSPPIPREQPFVIVESSASVVVASLDELFTPGAGSEGVFHYAAEPDGTVSIFSEVDVLAGEIRMVRKPGEYGAGVISVSATDENGLKTRTNVTFFARPDYTLTVPDDFRFIQDAIESLTEPAVVLVRPGTYFEDIDFDGRSVFLRSTEGPHLTTIIGSGSKTAVSLGRSGENDPGGELSGFTIRSGADSGLGFPRYSLIRNNIVERFQGIGIAALGDGVIFDGNVIRHNESEDRTLVTVTGEAIVTGNVFYGNRAGDEGVVSLSENSTFVNNTLYRNEIALWLNGAAVKATVRNNIIASNTVGVATYTASEQVGLQWDHNLVFGNGTDYDEFADQTGLNGNVSVDPGFVGAPNGDFRLRADSPAIDAGIGTGLSPIDHAGAPRIQGAAVNMGAFEIEPPERFSILGVDLVAGRVVLYLNAPAPYFVEISDDLVSWNRRSPEEDFATIWSERHTSATPRYYRIGEASSNEGDR